MGEGGAAAFALAGLWGSHAAPRQWRLGRASLLLMMAAMMVAPGTLWAAGLYRPDFADALYGGLQPIFDHLLDFTRADEVARDVLAEDGDLHCWPAMRLGVAMCWLCALPSAAAVLLWFDDIPSHWTPRPERMERLKVLALMSGLLAATTTLVTASPGRHLLTPVFGAVAYPGLFCLWLLAIAGLRAWMHWGHFHIARP